MTSLLEINNITDQPLLNPTELKAFDLLIGYKQSVEENNGLEYTRFNCLLKTIEPGRTFLRMDHSSPPSCCMSYGLSIRSAFAKCPWCKSMDKKRK